MSNKYTAYYQGNTSVSVDFSADQISSDGAVVLLEKLARKHKLIKYFSKYIPDTRDQSKVVHSVEKLLKQRVFNLIQGYEDANDADHLKADPLFEHVLAGQMASQPTISRFENSLDKHSIIELCYGWVDRYVSSLSNRKSSTIDIDATDDPTHGKQQLSMFNGFYGQFMYNELLFHDGDTGQIIVPVLRPGNRHSNKWYVSILKRVVKRIRKTYPEMQIIIRADSGFSCAPFYQLADDYDLGFCIAIPSNNRLKKEVKTLRKSVKETYADKQEKHQEFASFTYKADRWHKSYPCYAKVERTGIGMNVRFFVSNFEQQEASSIYFGFYVKRADASENRIKELKNMWFSDRLSNHGFWSNFLRLLMSSMAYEMFLLIKKQIRKTSVEHAKKWQISTIRTLLLKVGASIKITKRRIYYRFSKAFVYKDLFRERICS